MANNTEIALSSGGCTTERAWQIFDALPAAPVDEVTIGRWRGEEFDTGHPWFGVLAESGWYGKQFDTPNAVDPLLFSDERANVFAVDPRRVPLALAGRIRPDWLAPVRKNLRFLAPLLRTRTPSARLRDVDYRGVNSAAMIYDHLPIIDHFRRLDDNSLFGVMDMRGLAEPYFFVLRR